ncbi:chemotaxis-specific protein-glutamate methyltransferase CheB [Allosphingosinicella sp.]|uniref:chemotaxis-specific protein-glutamate methyltransferase CheB n=1 Tax=Allosphingosinicella sp. TaxID=2823234 RepID=UPI002F132E56
MTAPAAGTGGRTPPRQGDDPPIRLMIVDDSHVARAVLSRMIASQNGFEVVALAGNAAEALAALRSVKVDIVLLDLEMPGASGLEALPDILRAGAGARVLVVSSLCERGAQATVRALALGAADTLPKPGTSAFAGRFAQVLGETLRRIGRVAPRREEPVPADARVRLRAMPGGRLECLAIGASTGGFHAINDLLRALPARIGAPILVTQHLPTLFMPFFARQLEAACGRTAAVAEDGEKLRADHIHVAPGDAHIRLDRVGASTSIQLCRIPAASGCLPSADPMFASVGETYGSGAVGVVLSGMGRDGFAGSRRLVECGGAMLTQDKASAAIWGMPRAIAEAGLASAVLAPPDLAARIAARLEAGSCR